MWPCAPKYPYMILFPWHEQKEGEDEETHFVLENIN